MQEEVESRTVTLMITSAKMTANVLRAAIQKYLAYQKEKRCSGEVSYHGSQTAKQLAEQAPTEIKITDENIREFERVARKHGVEFSLRQDTSAPDPRYLVSFKARSTKALTAALREYAKEDRGDPNRLSISEQLKAVMPQETAIEAPLTRSKVLDAR